MSANSKKPVSYKKQGRGRNSGSLVMGICVLIFAFFAICSVFYIFGAGRSSYTVISGSSKSKYSGQYTALAIREEEVFTSPLSGYINYLATDTSMIYVGEDICIIDENGELSEALSEAASTQSILTSDNLSDIQSTIYDFDTSFSPENYYDAYTFKYKLESQISELINSSIFNDIKDSLSGSYSVLNSDTAGVIVHSVDGFEDITTDDIEANTFKKTDYSKEIIKTNDFISVGSKIYKVVTSDDWELVFQIDDPADFEETTSLTITILKDKIEATGDFSTFTSGGNSYGVLSLDKYMIRYISDRYLQISIVDNSQVSGLLVPKKSITEKQFYMIPSQYVTKGGTTSSYGFLRQYFGVDGTSTVDFVIPEIIKSTDDYYYVSMDSFSAGDIIIMPDSSGTYQISAKDNLQGVYVSDGGYAQFKLAEIIGENGDFYVVKSGLTNGVKLYDQIVKDASDLSEGDSVS